MTRNSARARQGRTNQRRASKKRQAGAVAQVTANQLADATIEKVAERGNPSG